MKSTITSSVAPFIKSGAPQAEPNANAAAAALEIITRAENAEAVNSSAAAAAAEAAADLCRLVSS